MAEVKKAVPELECANCGTTSELTPILTYVHQGEEKHICTRLLANAHTWLGDKYAFYT